MRVRAHTQSHLQEILGCRSINLDRNQLCMLVCKNICVFIYVVFLFVLCFRLTGWVLLKLFNSFFWNIQIHKGQLEMVKAATEARISVNLLPHFPLISRVILELLWKYSLVYCYVFQPIWKISLL